MSTEQTTPHLTEEQALLMAEGGPVPQELRAAAEHYEACRPCRRLVRSVKQAVGALRHGELPSIPTHLSARVLDLINEPVSPMQPDLLPRKGILGRLIFERPIPIMSVRSGGPTAGRLLRFNTDEESIDVTVSEAGPEMVSLRVAVLGVTEPVSAVLSQSDSEKKEATASDGAFALDEVKKGKAHLRIVFEDREITFDIDLT